MRVARGGGAAAVGDEDGVDERRQRVRPRRRADDDLVVLEAAVEHLPPLLPAQVGGEVGGVPRAAAAVAVDRDVLPLGAERLARLRRHVDVRAPAAAVAAAVARLAALDRRRAGAEDEAGARVVDGHGLPPRVGVVLAGVQQRRRDVTLRAPHLRVVLPPVEDVHEQARVAQQAPAAHVVRAATEARVELGDARRDRRRVRDEERRRARVWRRRWGRGRRARRGGRRRRRQRGRRRGRRRRRDAPGARDPVDGSAAAAARRTAARHSHRRTAGTGGVAHPIDVGVAFGVGDLSTQKGRRLGWRCGWQRQRRQKLGAVARDVLRAGVAAPAAAHLDRKGGGAGASAEGAALVQRCDAAPMLGSQLDGGGIVGVVPVPSATSIAEVEAANVLVADAIAVEGRRGEPWEGRLRRWRRLRRRWRRRRRRRRRWRWRDGRRHGWRLPWRGWRRWSYRRQLQ